MQWKWHFRRRLNYVSGIRSDVLNLQSLDIILGDSSILSAEFHSRPGHSLATAPDLTVFAESYDSRDLRFDL